MDNKDKALLTELLTKWRNRASQNLICDGRENVNKCSDELESALSRLLAQEGEGMVPVTHLLAIRDALQLIASALIVANDGQPHVISPKVTAEAVAAYQLLSRAVNAAAPDAEGEIHE